MGSRGHLVGGSVGIGRGGGGTASTGFGRIRGLSANRNVRLPRAPSRIPNVSLVLRSTSGLKLPASVHRRAEVTLRLCTVGFDIRRLRKAAASHVKTSPPPLNDTATAQVAISSIGRASTVKIIQQGAQFDAGWHRCATRVLRSLNFAKPGVSNAGVTAQTIDVEINVR